MTNELEKTFFDTFEIEPNADIWWCENDNKICDCDYDCDETCRTHKTGYPQISDRRLLELICILLSNNSPYMFKLGDWDVEKLKDTILTMCIKLPDFLEWEDTSDNFKHQVRTLFEEG